MAQENIEVVRVVIDAFNRGDWEVALRPFDPGFELDFSRAIGPLRGVYRLDQARAFLDEFFGVWEAVRFEVDQFVEAGDQVATSFVNHHRGRDGIEVTVRPSGVWTIRDGRIVHACVYQEWPEALEAVGLSD
jgi:ketosteroid isomerase-like protein